MSAPVIPPGSTIVSTFQRSFVDVPIDEANGNAVRTTEFLEAAESLTTIFGTAYNTIKRHPAIPRLTCHRRPGLRRLLPRQERHPWQRQGSYTRHATHVLEFQPLLTRKQKIRDRQLASPADSENIQDLVRNELKTKKHVATEGLLWLVRYASHPEHVDDIILT